MDAELQPGFRWIELTLPAAVRPCPSSEPATASPPGSTPASAAAPTTPVPAHATGLDLGLRAGELLDWETAPLMFEFEDPDGNRFYVTETS